ncbi:MAG: hypothetical protein ACKVQJ_08655 [Pyrinomonadaceae bacterium]
MSKDVIKVDGEDVVVREDTAKAYRFVHWGVITAAIGLIIMIALFAIFFWRAASDGKLVSPADSSKSTSR